MNATLPSTAHSTLKVTALAYLPAVAAMMTIGVLVPFIHPLCTDLNTTRAAIGFALALFSVPSAVLATVGGGVIDAYGVRRSMIVATALSALGSLLASRANSLAALDGAMLVAGLGFGGLCVGLPCLIMAALDGGARIRAMSFASTFAPTGYAAGLLLAVPFTASGTWREALGAHALLMAVMLVSLLLAMPPIASAQTGRAAPQRWTGMLQLLRNPAALRLGLAVALPNALSYGTSLAAPSYLARVHHLSLATSSASVALAKLTAMVIGGLSMGHLLSRSVPPRLLFIVMAVIGLIAQAALFLPAQGIALATAALVVWLFAFGGMTGGAMTLLPAVARDPARSGAASGLVNQFISLASFAAPSTWLALENGWSYVLLAAGCLIVSAVALPSVGSAIPGVTEIPLNADSAPCVDPQAVGQRVDSKY